MPHKLEPVWHQSAHLGATVQRVEEVFFLGQSTVGTSDRRVVVPGWQAFDDLGGYSRGCSRWQSTAGVEGGSVLRMHTGAAAVVAGEGSESVTEEEEV